MAKPFVKWAGGKGKLLQQLEAHLPADFAQQETITYIEPFVGGGAMLFHMLENHPNINRVIINDINPELISCYNQVKYEPENLIEELERLQKQFNEGTSQEDRKKLFYIIRDDYNRLKQQPFDILDEVTKAAEFIFLNRTCFNGLYRENRSGEYNVPFGRYSNPTICDKDKIKAASQALQKVEILCGDYKKVLNQVNEDENAFFYFDPPYRPLEGSANFKDYTKFEFGDLQQEELKQFCDLVSEKGHKLMVSNSYCVDFFTNLYTNYSITEVLAPRVINAFAARRVPQQEVLITNYEEIGHA